MKCFYHVSDVGVVASGDKIMACRMVDEHFKVDYQDDKSAYCFIFIMLI